jgi:heat shock protein HspQ
MGSLYLKWFTAYLIGTLASVLTFNFFVDPFGIYDVASIKGFNIPKVQIEKNEKLAKAMLVNKVRPKSIVLGSSRAEFGIDPAYSRWPDTPVYNLALAGADAYLMKRYLQHADAMNKLKEVVIGLDFFSFNIRRPQAKDFQEENLAVDPQGRFNPGFKWKILLKSLFTLSATKSSITTVWGTNHFIGQIIDPHTGLRKFAYRGRVVDLKKRRARYDELKKKMGKDFRPEKAGVRPHASFLRNENTYIRYVYFSGPKREYVFSDATTGQSSLKDLREIIQFCKKERIKLFLFISPVHARQMEAIRSIGLWPVFEQWKRELVKLIREESEPNGEETPLWDFSGYNSITTENVPEADLMRGYLDSAHYQPDVGDMILDRMFQHSSDQLKKHPDFGRRLTMENIERSLTQIRKEQALYHKSHSRDVQEVEELARKAGVTSNKVILIGKDYPTGARLNHTG